jgi:hypothetical protein
LGASLGFGRFSVNEAAFNFSSGGFVFITNVTRVVPIAGRPGYSALIRKLTRKQLRKAREARQTEGIARVRELGGAAFMRELQEIGGAEKAKADAAKSEQADVLLEYDEDTVLAAGVVGFDPTPTMQLPEAIDRLDEVVGPWLAREVIAFSRGEREDEDAAKNG